MLEISAMTVGHNGRAIKFHCPRLTDVGVADAIAHEMWGILGIRRLPSVYPNRSDDGSLVIELASRNWQYPRIIKRIARAYAARLGEDAEVRVSHPLPGKRGEAHTKTLHVKRPMDRRPPPVQVAA